MAEKGGESSGAKLGELLHRAFAEAYPEVDGDTIDHMSRNFTQVVQGVIDIGGRVEHEDVSHMDVANGLVYSCVANTYLEDLLPGKNKQEGPEGTRSVVRDDDMDRILRECSARVADWLLALELTKRVGDEAFRKFVKGAVALGAGDWERNRGELRY